MRAVWLGAVSALALSVGGCSVLGTPVERGSEFSGTLATWRYQTENNRWIKAHEQWAFTTADVRVITQRMHPVLGNEVVCAEPGPDVAKALSTAADIAASGGSGSVSGQASFSGGSAEAAMALAGRSTALLALRDGLYRACEAYGNGVLGQDMYALITARYASLLTTLFLAEDMTGTVGAAGSATAVSQALNIAGAAAAASKSGPSGSGSSNDGGNKTDLPVAPPALPSLQLAALSPQDHLRQGAQRWRVVDHGSLSDVATPLFHAIALNLAGNPPAANPPAANPPAADKTPAADAEGPTPSGSTDQAGKSAPATTSGTGSSAPTTDAAGAVAALGLVRMNEDYLNQGLVDVLMSGCINESDPTRLRPRYSQSAQATYPDPRLGDAAVNGFLKPVCDQMFPAAPVSGKNPTEINNYLVGQLMALGDARLKAAPLVDPTRGLWAAQTPSTGASKPSGGIPTVTLVQQALATMTACPNCNPKRTDGLIDQQTMTAVAAYQKLSVAKFKGKAGKPNGDPLDPDTLKALNIKAPASPSPASSS